MAKSCYTFVIETLLAWNKKQKHKPLTENRRQLTGTWQSWANIFSERKNFELWSQLSYCNGASIYLDCVDSLTFGILEVIFVICIFRGSRLQTKTGMHLGRIKFGFVRVAGKGYYVLNNFTQVLCSQSQHSIVATTLFSVLNSARWKCCTLAFIWWSHIKISWPELELDSLFVG